ncbi:MAG TPA: ABC transporter ATP-binding protein [Burkholderiales bacterium]|nr:ABC transporter ATP-binding protein [Burkholderiales bacterium]
MTERRHPREGGDPSSTDLAIDVRGMTKRFGKLVAVDHIDLQVPAGKICGFLGPNGSGKTTFIRMLCGLLRPDDGSGTCLGYDVIRESASIKREVGYMTQRFSFYEDLSIAENLDFVASVYQVRERKRAVEDSLERLGLQRRRDQLAGTLSGGWKQRLALAACLIHSPKLLLLDEPTAGVDPKARREFWEEIHAYAAEGLTFLVTTHYMDEAERCDRLAFISDGKLLTYGTVDEVVAHANETMKKDQPTLEDVFIHLMDEKPGSDPDKAGSDPSDRRGRSPASLGSDPGLGR